MGRGAGPGGAPTEKGVPEWRGIDPHPPGVEWLGTDHCATVKSAFLPVFLRGVGYRYSPIRPNRLTDGLSRYVAVAGRTYNYEAPNRHPPFTCLSHSPGSNQRHEPCPNAEAGASVVSELLGTEANSRSKQFWMTGNSPAISTQSAQSSKPNLDIDAMSSL